MTELATSRYASFTPEMGVPVAISRGRPKFPIRYVIEHEISALKPLGLMKLHGDDFIRAYRERLDLLDLAALTEKFEAISAQHDERRLVLLCFEDVHAGQLCHRRVFAERFEAATGIRVPEIENLATGKTPGALSGQLRLDVPPAPDGAPPGGTA